MNPIGTGVSFGAAFSLPWAVGSKGLVKTISVIAAGILGGVVTVSLERELYPLFVEVTKPYFNGPTNVAIVFVGVLAVFALGSSGAAALTQRLIPDAQSAK